MKTVICKAVLFIALLLVASQLLIRPFVYHPFWGDPDYISKYDRFFESTNEFNTVFIGSSRVLRQVQPILFDSITGLHSFNLGIDGAGCPFNYLLTREVIQSQQASNLDYIVLELFSPQENLTEEIMHSDKVVFRYGWDDFYFTVLATWQDITLSISEKMTETSIHFRNLAETASRLGQVHRIINSKDKSTRDKIGENGRGFVSCDYEVENNPDSFLIKLHNELLLHPEILKELARYSQTNFTTSQVGKNHFEYHWKYLLNLQHECEIKGIELVLVISPLMTEKQVRFFNSFLPNAPISLTILNYSRSDLYPDYYQMENVFDKGHLNTKGTRLFTTTLATDFNQLVKELNK